MNRGIPAIAAVIVRGDQIGTLRRGAQRSFRPGRLDAFIGGEIQSQESPLQALNRELGEKIHFASLSTTDMGDVRIPTHTGSLLRRVFRLAVPEGTEPEFTEPLPNHKFEGFEWHTVGELHKLEQQGELLSDSWLILDKAGLK